MNILFGDTETSGLPIWKIPSDDESQPHMTQIAALLVDGQSEKTISSIDVIVRPNGWEIPPETSEIHGITHEYAMDVGVSEKLALEMYMALWDVCNLRVFHSTTFDNRIIRIALKRYMPDFVPDDVWKDRALYFCTLNNARKIMGGSSGHTLEEVYKYFTGKDLENAHSAMADTTACKSIYFAIKKHLKEDA